jgi:hypothetical protein
MKFFPKDFDCDMSAHPLEIRGAWITIINHLWNTETRGRAEYSMTQWASVLRVDETSAERIIKYLCNAGVTGFSQNGNGNLTLFSRRMAREEKERENTRLRVKRFREKPEVTPPCNGDVTPYMSDVRSQKSEKNITTLDQNFVLFWSSYPKKIGKKDAEKSWIKSKDKPPLETILKAIENQKKSEQWNKDGGQFIPNPATWINQGRWDDEPKIKTGHKTLKQIVQEECP